MEYSEEEKRRMLHENGYHTVWAEDNWVHENDSNPDSSGRSLEDAFQSLLAKQRFQNLFN
jgi:hypothetical protein